jgi:hypothetical protein
MILRVLRLEVSVYNVHITNQFQTTLLKGGGGGVNQLLEVTVKSKNENSEDFCPIHVKNSASGLTSGSCYTALISATLCPYTYVLVAVAELAAWQAGALATCLAVVARPGISSLKKALIGAK